MKKKRKNQKAISDMSQFKVTFVGEPPPQTDPVFLEILREAIRRLSPKYDYLLSGKHNELKK
jgi:hypothetical protein